MVKNVMCYGDSNTWGYIPGSGLRYAPDERWTGICQAQLGPEYRIIEEGLSGRTTVLDCPWTCCRNGADGFGYAILSQMPLDLVVIFLGTNDLVMDIPRHVALGADELVRRALNADVIYNTDHPVFPNGPKVLLVSPVPFNPIVESRPDFPACGHYEDSCGLAARYKAIAENRKVEFFDAAPYATPSEVDGVHLTKEGHRAIGVALAEKIRSILAD